MSPALRVYSPFREVALPIELVLMPRSLATRVKTGSRRVIMTTRATTKRTFMIAVLRQKFAAYGILLVLQ